jgi:predicted phage terminase large subunit-like protein
VPAAVLWPDRESLYELMKLRATIGPAAFNHEKQNNPVDPEACEWGAEYFDYPGFWFERWPDKLEVKTIGLDPSKGKDSKLGDYSAYVLYGVDACGMEYVEADLRRRPSEQIVADGVEHCRRFAPDGMAVEVNQFQELLVADFQQVAQAQKVALPIYAMDNTVNKDVRIRRNGPYLYQRRTRFKAHSPGTKLLVDQLRDFPIGDFDDGADALEMARRLAIQLLTERVQRQPTRLAAW